MPDFVSNQDADRARRFRDATLPYLDDAYTLARYLLRDPDAAEDAVQDCYLRALKHFGGFRGPSIKPWLLAILRNVCRVEFARRAASPQTSTDDASAEPAEEASLWHEPNESPEANALRHCDADAIQKMIAEIAEPFRETLVLREIHNLSYREIAEIVGAPVGTVMSRLARARALLRTAWMADKEQST